MHRVLVHIPLGEKSRSRQLFMNMAALRKRKCGPAQLRHEPVGIGSHGYSVIHLVCLCTCAIKPSLTLPFSESYTPATAWIFLLIFSFMAIFLDIYYGLEFLPIALPYICLHDLILLLSSCFWLDIADDFLFT